MAACIPLQWSQVCHSKHDDYSRGDDADDNLSSRFESGSAIESGNESDYVFPFSFFVKWFVALKIYNL